MISQEIYDSIENKIMYGIGETITVIGLFITIVGMVTMIYHYVPESKDVEFNV